MEITRQDQGLFANVERFETPHDCGCGCNECGGHMNASGLTDLFTTESGEAKRMAEAEAAKKQSTADLMLAKALASSKGGGDNTLTVLGISFAFIAVVGVGSYFLFRKKK